MLASRICALTLIKVEHAIGLIHCDYCWVKNVRVDNVGRSGVTTRWGYGMVLRDSYLDAPPARGGPTQYGTECYMSSNVLVENNIFWNITNALQVQNCMGSVYAYNYLHNRVADNLYPHVHHARRAQSFSPAGRKRH